MDRVEDAIFRRKIDSDCSTIKLRLFCNLTSFDAILLYRKVVKRIYNTHVPHKDNSTVRSMAYLHVKLSDFYDFPTGSMSGNDPPPSTGGSDTMACRIYVVEFDVR
jgi:hypothetical protein